MSLVSVKLVQEVVTTGQPAHALVYLDSLLVGMVTAVVVEQDGADGKKYPAVRLALS